MASNHARFLFPTADSQEAMI
uniref:Uncharacterized protein n=1 Tax=Anguilla anguilla TaxID=7936 RepID=A0A0E9QQG3_ANGAN